jgi:hypothetical protein
MVFNQQISVMTIDQKVIYPIQFQFLMVFMQFPNSIL